jgi:hypothetical protein
MRSSIQPSGCTGRNRALDRIRPSQTQRCEFLVFLGKVKDRMSIDNNKQKLHWQCLLLLLLLLFNFWEYFTTLKHKWA